MKNFIEAVTKFNRKQVALACLVLSVVCLAITAMAAGGHAEGLLAQPGAMGIFGFIGGWILIIVSKMIMMPILQKGEDFYDEEDDK